MTSAISTVPMTPPSCCDTGASSALSAGMPARFRMALIHEAMSEDSSSAQNSTIQKSTVPAARPPVNRSFTLPVFSGDGGMVNVSLPVRASRLSTRRSVAATLSIFFPVATRNSTDSGSHAQTIGIVTSGRIVPSQKPASQPYAGISREAARPPRTAPRPKPLYMMLTTMPR